MRAAHIVSPDKGFIADMKLLLRSVGQGVAVSASLCCADAKNAVLSGEYDIVIVDGNLPGEPALELAVMITEKTNSGCLIIAAPEQSDAVADKLADAGVFLLDKPLDKTKFCRTVRLVDACRRRLEGIRRDHQKLKRRLDEIKAVNRAKMVLMQYLKFSEEQAHRYIEKQAMDLRMTRYEIAMKVIKTYDLDV